MESTTTYRQTYDKQASLLLLLLLLHLNKLFMFSCHLGYSSFPI